MHDTIDSYEKPKSQTATWIVAGILAASLIALNLWPSGEETASSEAETVAVAPSVATPESVPTRRSIQWPDFDFESVVRNNPFEMRASQGKNRNDTEVGSEAQDALAKEAAARESLPTRELDAKRYPVHMIFHSPRGRSALVGTQVVEVGDEIDGMRVVDIAQSGVTLKPID